jgi:hypothetical protein
MDLTVIPGINHSRAVEMPATMLEPLRLLLPNTPGTPLPTTQTLDPKVIHHQAMSTLKVALNHVHTTEDLQHLTSGLQAIM